MSFQSYKRVYADKRTIQLIFDKWNRLFFNNKLKPIPIKFTYAYSPGSIASFSYDKETGEAVCFTFNGTRAMYESDLEDTVIHEMIHYYIRVVLKDLTSESHGETFLRMMDRVNRLFSRNVTISKSFCKTII